MEGAAAEPRILLRRRRAPPATTARPRRPLGLTEPRRERQRRLRGGGGGGRRRCVGRGCRFAVRPGPRKEKREEWGARRPAPSAAHGDDARHIRGPSGRGGRGAGCSGPSPGRCGDCAAHRRPPPPPAARRPRAPGLAPRPQPRWAAPPPGFNPRGPEERARQAAPDRGVGVGRAAAGWASRRGCLWPLRRARVAINGEWEVGDVGRPSSGRVTAKPVSLVGKILRKAKGDSGGFVAVVGGPPLEFQADLRSKSLGREARLSPGASGSSPWAAAQVGSWRG